MRGQEHQFLLNHVVPKKGFFALAVALAVTTMFATSGRLQAAGNSLADAAYDGDLAKVQELIANGADANETQADGTSALIWATYNSFPEMAEALIAAGADVNASNNFGVTPLLQASRTGDAAMIRLLLDKGADLNKTYTEGETPLMLAARAGSVESVTLLLERGADPNAVESSWNQTALMWAAAEGHLGVVDALLNGGADPNMQARVSELTKRSTRSDFYTGGFTALMWAGRDGNEAVVRRLVEGGADINMTNGDGATAMTMAIVNDLFDFVPVLLDLGADPNDGSLYQAVLMRDATTDWLAQDGTRLRANYDNELTALDLTRLLLEAGADPNKPYVRRLHSTSMCCDTFENGTPFFRAAVAGDVAAMQLLIDHGANIEWTPEKSDEDSGPGSNKNAGRTPLMVAMYGGQGVGMAGGPGDIREGNAPPFREVANREPLDAVRLLLDAGANPDAVNPDGDAALHLAAKDGKLDIIRALADGGATLDLPNKDGQTALEVVEKMPPREPPPLTGALAGKPQGAQPAEVAALLRELMQSETPAQANLEEGR